MRRLLPLLACLLLAAGCGSEDPKSAAEAPKEAARQLAGSPPALKKVHAQANRLLGGGPDAYLARIRELKGHPIVVNKWGSWCPPCRAEFPYFQSQSVKRGKEIAFLGVNVQDSRSAARRWLRDYPVQFPSYEDPDLKVAAAMKAVSGTPATAFYSRDGELAHVRYGGYTTERKLVEDIERYAR